MCYVYGEPAVVFQLNNQGMVLARPVADLGIASPQAERPKLPTFLIAGPHAARSTVFEQEFAKAAPRFRLVRRFEYQPSRLVQLDQRREADRGTAASKETVALYRVE